MRNQFLKLDVTSDRLRYAIKNLNDVTNNVFDNLILNTDYTLTNGFVVFDTAHFFTKFPTVGVIILSNYGNNWMCDFTGSLALSGSEQVVYFDRASLLLCLQASEIFPSLNGNGSEFIDGTEVLVNGRTIIYTVARSYMGLIQDNAYTTMYDLTSVNGSKLTVPESLLTQYIAPVIVP